jgi:protease-4
LSGEPDFVGGFSDDVNAVLQAGVENGYQDFLTLVAESRGKTKAEVDVIGQGRGWDGGTARQLGLVDGFGGMTEALAEAAKRADLKDGGYYPQYLEAPIEFKLLPSSGIPFVQSKQAPPITNMVGWVARQQKATFAEALNTAKTLVASEDIKALCLECGSTNTLAESQSIDWFTWLKSYAFLSGPR